MNEEEVEKHTRKFLEEEGWKLSNQPKTIGQHGCDIIAFHPKRRKTLHIEAKGDGNLKNKHQAIHNSFYIVLGQILSRMDKEGNSPNKARTYAIAIPKAWETAYKKKAKQMPYGWKLLKLKIFLVNKQEVLIKNYMEFLK